MAHNVKKNKRHSPSIEEEDYEYKSAKVRETKTRNRRHDRDVIAAGLDAYENPEHSVEEDEDELLNDYEDMIDRINATEYDDDYDDSCFDDFDRDDNLENFDDDDDWEAY